MKKPDEAEEPIQKSLNLVLTKLTMINEFTPKNSEENNDKMEALQKINQELGILYDTYARVKFDQKKYSESEEFEKKSLAFLLSGFGEDKTAEPFITRALLKLADCFVAQGKTKEADDLYGKLIAEQKAMGNDLTVASYYRLFGNSALQFKSFDLAEQYFEEAVNILEEHAENPKALTDFVELLSALVSIKSEAGREEEDIKSTIHRLVTQAEQLEIELPKSKSSYFTTEEAAVQFQIDNDESNFQVKPYFTFTITVNENVEIPSESVLVVEYPRMKEEENSEEEEEEEEEVKYSTVELPVNSSALLDSKKYQFESPKLPKLDENYYLLNVTLYSDALQSTKLIRHPIIVKCPMDTSSVTTKEEFEEKL
jgi:tetratricopeptide (TPR) repeat protein